MRLACRWFMSTVSRSTWTHCQTARPLLRRTRSSPARLPHSACAGSARRWAKPAVPRPYLLMVGQLSNQAAVQRTKDFHDVMAWTMWRNFINIDRRTDRQLVPRRSAGPDDQLDFLRRAL